MAQTAPLLGPQPDFNLISESIRMGGLTLATQFERCANLPAVNQGNQMVGLLQRIDQRLERMDQRLERVERRLGMLEEKIDHQSSNAMARLQNAYNLFPHDPLTPLTNPTTGNLIPNMPADSNAIARMTAIQITALLQELGQPVPNNQQGGVARLRRLLRVQLGLKGEQSQGA